MYFLNRLIHRLWITFKNKRKSRHNKIWILLCYKHSYFRTYLYKRLQINSNFRTIIKKSRNFWLFFIVLTPRIIKIEVYCRKRKRFRKLYTTQRSYPQPYKSFELFRVVFYHTMLFLSFNRRKHKLNDKPIT